MRLFQLWRWFRRPRADPYRDFAFRVLVDGRPVAGATSSSVTRATTSSHYREPITLEGGLTHDGPFVAWATKTAALEPAARTTTTLAPVRRDVIVERRNEAGQLAGCYRVFGAWISTWRAAPADGADGAGLHIDALTIEHEGWQRVSSTNGSDGHQNV